MGVALLICLSTSLGVWARPATQLEGPALSSGEPPADYRIHPFDLIDVRVDGAQHFSATTRVSQAGYFRLPFVREDMNALCLTAPQLADLIQCTLRCYLADPHVTVVIREANGARVGIIGAVASPGWFNIMRPVTLLELIALAGGPTHTAGKTVYVKHVGSQNACDLPAPAAVVASSKEAFSLGLLLSGDPKQNPVLRPGDIVVVQQGDLVYIGGSVARPGAYPFRGGMTLGDLVIRAGGPAPGALSGRAEIVRRGDVEPPQVLEFNLTKILERKAADPQLRVNDVIEIEPWPSPAEPAPTVAPPPAGLEDVGRSGRPSRRVAH
jgi:polysaccharide export outer membrane protein